MGLIIDLNTQNKSVCAQFELNEWLNLLVSFHFKFFNLLMYRYNRF